MRKFNVKVNGVFYEVEVEEMTGEQVQSAQTATEPVKTEQPKAAQNVSAPAGGTKVTAPMPGTIKKVKVTNGMQVKKNDVLLILEAMKLENEIYAPCDGTVTFVGVSEGQSVNPGDALCTIG